MMVRMKNSFQLDNYALVIMVKGKQIENGSILMTECLIARE